MRGFRIMVIMIMIEKALLSNVQWNIKQKMIEIGKSLVLDCEISHNFQPNKSRQWTRGEENQLLCFDNIAIDSNKYDGRIHSPTAYSLTILNLTEDDLVYVYSCRVGFAFKKKQIEVNDSNLLHTPETTDVKYEMWNGNYSLRLDFSQVFPKPLCRVKLNDEYKNLTIANEKQPRVLYRVVYVLESTEALHSCGETVNIECDIGRQKLNISAKHDLDCKTLDETKSTIIPYTAIAVSITAFFVVVVTLILVCYIYIRHKNSKGKEYKPTTCNEDMLVNMPKEPNIQSNKKFQPYCL
ncbi:Hypothetical predicted protein [Mytilus galloprovincialis]|uniref:Ig-like domain-containing protein n=1 Tax=Mytilus galloprovincialis TaxID=29158 RepID=A0A8B6FKA7_MYTGA|nr:Hypothetical predicted protein [Mytilus galloprovincialis]